MENQTQNYPDSATSDNTETSEAQTEPICGANTAIYRLLELAVGAQSRADFAQLHVNDIVYAATRCGATWEQVGQFLSLTAEEAETKFADASGSITVDEDVAITLGYIAKKRGLATFSAAISYVLDAMLNERSPEAAPSSDAGCGTPTDEPDGR